MTLYRKHRPTDFDQVIGQASACNLLKKKIADGSLPNVVLLVGPSGTGKTTTARIAASKLGCTPANLTEINTADSRGIDLVREIDQTMWLRPMGGDSRVWILDEVVQLPTITQKAFLKVLEEPPSHAYFFLCATETTGLLPTFLSRCLILPFNELNRKSVEVILVSVLFVEGKTIPLGVLSALVEASDGNARKALQLLEHVLVVEDPQEQLQAVEAGRCEQAERGEFLGRLLIKKARWSEMLAAVKDLEEKDIEGLRRQILGYMAKCMAGRDAALAAAIIDAFDEPFYQSGKAGLLVALYTFRERTMR